MSFSKNDRRRFDPHRAQRFVLPRRPPWNIVRIVLLALLGTGAAVWALTRHYTADLPPMRVPVPPVAPAATYDADAGELPVPDFERAP